MKKSSLRLLILSLMACSFIPTLIVVVISYWQKLVTFISEAVEDKPVLSLIWNISQIALALAILLAVAWIIRYIFRRLKSAKQFRIDSDSSNISIAIVVSIICCTVIVGVTSIFSNPVSNIVEILLSFIGESTDEYSSPVTSSVMFFTNMALFLWTAFWSFFFILGITEEIRGKHPSRKKAQALAQQQEAAYQQNPYEYQTNPQAQAYQVQYDQYGNPIYPQYDQYAQNPEQASNWQNQQDPNVNLNNPYQNQQNQAGGYYQNASQFDSNQAQPSTPPPTQEQGAGQFNPNVAANPEVQNPEVGSTNPH